MVVGDQHFTHFLPLQTAAYLSEEKDNGSQHPVNDTCSWTVAGPTSPPPSTLHPHSSPDTRTQKDRQTIIT